MAQIDIFGGHEVLAKPAAALELLATNKQIAGTEPARGVPLAAAQAVMLPSSLDPGAAGRGQTVTAHRAGRWIVHQFLDTSLDPVLWNLMVRIDKGQDLAIGDFNAAIAQRSHA